MNTCIVSYENLLYLSKTKNALRHKIIYTCISTLLLIIYFVEKLQKLKCLIHKILKIKFH